MVREDVPFRRDDRAAARCLALQFPAFLVGVGDDVNADEARRNLRQRGLDVAAPRPATAALRSVTPHGEPRQDRHDSDS